MDELNRKVFVDHSRITKSTNESQDHDALADNVVADPEHVKTFDTRTEAESVVDDSIGFVVDTKFKVRLARTFASYWFVTAKDQDEAERKAVEKMNEEDFDAESEASFCHDTVEVEEAI